MPLWQDINQTLGKALDSQPSAHINAVRSIAPVPAPVVTSKTDEAKSSQAHAHIPYLSEDARKRVQAEKERNIAQRAIKQILEIPPFDAEWRQDPPKYDKHGMYGKTRRDRPKSVPRGDVFTNFVDAPIIFERQSTQTKILVVGGAILLIYLLCKRR